MMRRAVIFTAVALTALLIVGGCNERAAQRSQEPIAEATKLEPASWGTIKLLHTYQGIFLASQPTQQDFEQAARNGVRAVVNLRYDHEITAFDERQVVVDLGLDYIHLPWNGVDELTDEIFDRARQLLSTTERPALMHCGSANRVGALWLPWRVLDGGASLEIALAEARTVGLRDPAYEERARDYIRRRQADDGA